MRRRARFERTDVPTPSPRRDAIAVAAIIVVAIVSILIFSYCYTRAESYAHFNDPDLEDARDNQHNPDITALSASARKVDGIDTYLVLTRSEDGSSLKWASIFALNTNNGMMTRAELPVDLAVSTNSGTTTLSALFASNGGPDCVVPVSDVASIRFTHIMVVNHNFWDLLKTYSNTPEDQAREIATSLRASITTDLSNRSADDMLSQFHTGDAGDVAGVSYTTAEGASGSTINALELNVALGVLTA